MSGKNAIKRVVNYFWRHFMDRESDKKKNNMKRFNCVIPKD